MTTGEKLQKLRKENNYTQEDLADILQVSRQSISKWESDSAFPETEKLVALRKLYRVTIDYLLNEENNQLEIIEKPVSKKTDRLITFLKKLPLGIITSVFLILGFILFACPGFYLGKIANVDIYVNSYSVMFFDVKTTDFSGNVFLLIAFVLMHLNLIFIALHLSLETNYFKKGIYILNIITPLLCIISNICLERWNSVFFVWYLLYSFFAIIQFFIREPNFDKQVKSDAELEKAKKTKEKHMKSFSIVAMSITMVLITIDLICLLYGKKAEELPYLAIILMFIVISMPIGFSIPAFTKIDFKKKKTFLGITIATLVLSIIVFFFLTNSLTHYTVYN